jgi:hypothetical protein
MTQLKAEIQKNYPAAIVKTREHATKKNGKHQ